MQRSQQNIWDSVTVSSGGCFECFFWTHGLNKLGSMCNVVDGRLRESDARLDVNFELIKFLIEMNHTV